VRRGDERADDDAQSAVPLTDRKPRAPESTAARAALEAVDDQPAPVVGGDGLGVELHAVERPGAVVESHHDAVRYPRGETEALGHRADDQRVVPNGHEALRDPGEQRALVVLDRAEAAVHDLAGVLDRAAGDVRERLVAQADAQHRHLAVAQRVEGHADVTRVLGPSRPGEMTMFSTSRAASRSHGSSSLRTTTGASPLTSPSRWKRLKV
jgi:hypothetical protein